MIWAVAVGVENCFESFRELWKQIMGLDWFDEAQLIYEKEKKVNKESADQFWVILKGILQEITHKYYYVCSIWI